MAGICRLQRNQNLWEKTMKSLLGRSVYVVGFGTGVVVKESVIGGAVKCVVESNSIEFNGLKSEFGFDQLTPTCKGFK